MLATSSEDCLIKIWNFNKVIRDEHPEPLHTLRKHTGPLFSLSSCPNPRNNSEALLFSGGIEGDIKSWRVGSTSVSWLKSTLNGND
jgi:WD40 repeat protein